MNKTTTRAVEGRGQSAAAAPQPALHGRHYAFTQVLQASVNKPLTIEFSATRTSMPKWPVRIGLSILAFLAL